MHKHLSHTEFQTYYERLKSNVESLVSSKHAAQVIYNQIYEKDARLAKRWRKLNGVQDAHSSYGLPATITAVAFGIIFPGVIWAQSIQAQWLENLLMVLTIMCAFAAVLAGVFVVVPKIVYALFAHKARKHFPDRDGDMWRQIAERTQYGPRDVQDAELCAIDIRADLARIVFQKNLADQLEEIVGMFALHIKNGNMIEKTQAAQFCELVQRACDWPDLTAVDKDAWRRQAALLARCGAQDCSLLENESLQELKQSSFG